MEMEMHRVEAELWKSAFPQEMLQSNVKQETHDPPGSASGGPSTSTATVTSTAPAKDDHVDAAETTGSQTTYPTYQTQ